MKKILAALVGSVLLLTGCSSIDSGYVYDKIYEEGYYYVAYYQCMSYSSAGYCTIQVPVYQYDDPDWRLNIRNGDETGWVYVSEYTWNTYEVGDWYPHGI